MSRNRAVRITSLGLALALTGALSGLATSSEALAASDAQQVAAAPAISGSGFATGSPSVHDPIYMNAWAAGPR